MGFHQINAQTRTACLMKRSERHTRKETDSKQTVVILTISQRDTQTERRTKRFKKPRKPLMNTKNHKYKKTTLNVKRL